jgi:hypothetical protein
MNGTPEKNAQDMRLSTLEWRGLAKTSTNLRGKRERGMEKWRCDVTAKPGPLDPGNLYHTKYLDETQPELKVL